MNLCNICGRKYIYDRSKGCTKNKCNSCLVNHRRFTLKIKCVEYLGGKCSICGYNKCIKALDFHHLRDKSFNISGAHCRSWSIIEQELKKCILVCANCHREIHESD